MKVVEIQKCCAVGHTKFALVRIVCGLMRRSIGSGQMREASDVRRVAAIAGVATVAIVALLVGKLPFFATTVQLAPASHATEPQTARGDTIAFVTSPTIDPDPQFFFGVGDGSNGYYASGRPTLVSYVRMP
jgi:hypothetical protein